MNNPYRVFYWLRSVNALIAQTWLHIVFLWAAVPLSFGISYIVFNSTDMWWLILGLIITQYCVYSMRTGSENSRLCIPAPVSDLISIEKDYLRTELTHLLLSLIAPVWAVWIFGSWLLRKVKQKQHHAHSTALIC